MFKLPTQYIVKVILQVFCMSHWNLTPCTVDLACTLIYIEMAIVKYVCYFGMVSDLKYVNEGVFFCCLIACQKPSKTATPATADLIFDSSTFSSQTGCLRPLTLNDSRQGAFCDLANVCPIHYRQQSDPWGAHILDIQKSLYTNVSIQTCTCITSIQEKSDLWLSDQSDLHGSLCINISPSA